ncbi:BTAD domain-containing putative transcriptional regulator [Actinoplanes sp. N902-109]|uniref:BTAD domain-containing putative transcriptional regulator n=1 Tax=Actinoplanes sp. (strain N902-109) TaxID=649831 RepID=UPI0005A0BC9F|nr:BTAD domain-containing putative transcriptional regulator [Actinoplanes sp. N902-109]
MSLDVRVLGEVQIRIDGEPQLRRAQEKKALAILVAARGPLRPEAFLGAIWDAGHPTARDALLAPVIARLRRILRDHGLDITSARQSRGYQLVGDRLSEVVDAYRFERLARSALALLEADDDEAAEPAFATAADAWTGEPFAEFATGWAGAEPMWSFRAGLSRVREKLVEQMARTALTQGRYDRAGTWSGLEMSHGLERYDALWLLRVLEVLRSHGVPAAEELVELGNKEGLDPATTARAFDLISLHEYGIDVHRPLPGALVVRCRQLDDLSPWRAVAGALWAHLRRDLSQGSITAAQRKLVVDFVAADEPAAGAHSGRDLGQLIALLAALLRAVLRSMPLVLTFEDAHLISPVARQVLDELADRLREWPLELRTTGVAAAVAPDHDERAALRAYEIMAGRVAQGERLTAPVAVQMARYAQRARRLLPAETVARAMLAAARAERRGYAARAAVDWAEAGLRLEVPAPLTFELLMTLGDAHADLGATAEASRQYRLAYDAAEGRPELQAGAAVRLARQWSDPGLIDEQMVFLLRRALAGLDPRADAVRLQLQAHLAHKSTMAVPSDLASGPDLARGTLAELTAAYDPEVRCEVLNECRWGLYDYAPPGELAGVAENLREAAIAAGSPYFQSEALLALIIDHLRLGGLPYVHAAVKDHRKLVAEHPRPQGEWLQGVLDTLMHLWRGTFEGAAAWLFGPGRQAVDELRSRPVVPADNLRQTWQGQAYWLLRELGRTEELFAQDLTGDIEHDAHFPIWPAALILACCDTGRHEEAADRLGALLIRHHRFAGWPPHGWTTPTAALLAEAVAALHPDPVAVEALPLLRAMLAPHRDELVLAGWPVAVAGPAARFIGLLALAEGDAGTAVENFAWAATLAQDSPPILARIRYDHARALRHDAPRESAALAQRAHATAARLGMVTLAAAAAELC